MRLYTASSPNASTSSLFDSERLGGVDDLGTLAWRDRVFFTTRARLVLPNDLLLLLLARNFSTLFLECRTRRSMCWTDARSTSVVGVDLSWEGIGSSCLPLLGGQSLPLASTSSESSLACRPCDAGRWLPFARVYALRYGPSTRRGASFARTRGGGLDGGLWTGGVQNISSSSSSTMTRERLCLRDATRWGLRAVPDCGGGLVGCEFSRGDGPGELRGLECGGVGS